MSVHPNGKGPHVRESISASSRIALDMLSYELVQDGLDGCPSQDLQAGTLIKG